MSGNYRIHIIQLLFAQLKNYTLDQEKSMIARFNAPNVHHIIVTIYRNDNKMMSKHNQFAVSL